MGADGGEVAVAFRRVEGTIFAEGVTFSASDQPNSRRMAIAIWPQSHPRDDSIHNPTARLRF